MLNRMLAVIPHIYGVKEKRYSAGVILEPLTVVSIHGILYRLKVRGSSGKSS